MNDSTEIETKMAKSIKALASELSKVRTGRAHTDMLDHINIDYYGNISPINQISTVTVSGARTLTLQVWEKSMIIKIEKAIQMSDIGVTPTVKGSNILINLPAPTEERRKELTKNAKKLGEQAKIAVRNIRREYNQQIRNQEKDKEIDKDSASVAITKVDASTQKFISQINDMVEKKASELIYF